MLGQTGQARARFGELHLILTFLLLLLLVGAAEFAKLALDALEGRAERDELLAKLLYFGLDGW